MRNGPAGKGQNNGHKRELRISSIPCDAGVAAPARQPLQGSIADGKLKKVV